ncbi:MAG: hypothetical protein J6T17_01070 [Clostridia bacterium]|nr:hypothetical protein [Clostridia bacterium]
MKKAIAGAVLFGSGVLVGLGLSSIRSKPQAPVVESPPAAAATAASRTGEKCRLAVPPGKVVQSSEESTADACKRLGVTEAELQELWQIARNRGEKTLPSRDWVEHVYRPMKKARKASL